MEYYRKPHQPPTRPGTTECEEHPLRGPENSSNPPKENRDHGFTQHFRTVSRFTRSVFPVSGIQLSRSQNFYGTPGPNLLEESMRKLHIIMDSNSMTELFIWIVHFDICYKVLGEIRSNCSSQKRLPSSCQQPVLICDDHLSSSCDYDKILTL